MASSVIKTVPTFFSFIVPAYNRAFCIGATIESILVQEYQDYEIVIVDDGSTDDTKQLVETYLFKSDKIRYHQLPQNKGVNIAKNTGAELAHGKYYVFLDSDDRLLENTSLGKIYEIIEANNRPEILMFACIDLNSNPTILSTEVNGAISFADYFKGRARGEYLPVVAGDSFKRRKFYQDIKGGEGLTWQKIAKDSNSIYISNIAVRLYDNQGSDRLSVKSKQYYLRLQQVFRKDLNVNWKDYLKIYKKGLVNTLLRIVYYKLMQL